jgi:drug/metabolite transporter (DMT)-like permease
MRRPGVLYMAASALLFSAMSALVKVAGHRLPPAEIVFARVVLTLLLSIWMVRRAGLSPWGTRRAALALRGLLGFLALSCYYWTLTRLPLADATTIHQLAPLFTAIGAWVLLDERVGPAAWGAIVLGFAGVVLVARPGGLFGAGDVDPLGAAVALAGALCSGMAYVTVRQLARHEDPLVIVFYFPLVALPLALPWMIPVAVWPTAREWLVLVGIGVTTQGAQVCLTRGLALERAGRASAVGYLQVALAVLWGMTLFGETPGWTTLAGAALIVGGTAIVASTSR